MSGPLETLSVVDLSRGMAGGLATMLLSDNGARVIKVEPVGGDPLRVIATSPVWNRGKKSIMLDLGKPQAKPILSRLLKSADVLIESWRPGVAARLGIDYLSLRDEPPRLIYCSLTGYGQTGSERDRRGYDGLVQARVGMQWTQPGHRPGPIYMAFAAPTYAGGFMAAHGILAALHARARTGRGQHVDASLRDAAVVMNRWASAEHVLTTPQPVGLTTVRMFQCSDGEYLWVHTGARGSAERLAHALGLAESVIGLSSTQTSAMTARETAALLLQKAEAILASRPRSEWMARLDKADVPNRPALHAGECFDDEQVQAIGSVVAVDDHELPGPLREVAPPFRFRSAAPSVPGPAPMVGEHTGEILLELGFSDAEIVGFRRDAVA